MKQKQAQAIIIQSGQRKKKRKSTEFTKLKKQYTKQRKVTFSSTQKIKNDRISKYKDQLKASSAEKKQKSALLKEYKGKLQTRHKTFKTQFPAASKIKNVALLKKLISKLMKPSF